MKAATYLHGTYADVEPGTLLLPGAVIGDATWDYADPAIAGDEQHVWVTTCIENAICNVGGARDGLFYVYEVVPVGELRQPRLPCPDFTCESAVVMRRVLAVDADGELVEDGTS